MPIETRGLFALERAGRSVASRAREGYRDTHSLSPDKIQPPEGVGILSRPSSFKSLCLRFEEETGAAEDALFRYA